MLNQEKKNNNGSDVRKDTMHTVSTYNTHAKFFMSIFKRRREAIIKIFSLIK